MSMDNLGRTVETSGSCSYDGALPYVVALIIVDLGALLFAVLALFPLLVNDGFARASHLGEHAKHIKRGSNFPPLHFLTFPSEPVSKKNKSSSNKKKNRRHIRCDTPPSSTDISDGSV